MITNLKEKDVRTFNDLEEIGSWKYNATGNDPILEIKNLPNGLIQKISVTINVEYGEIIEFYWTYQEDENFTPSLRSLQALKPGVKKTYHFLIHSEEEIRKLRLDPTNAQGTVEIEEIKIFYIPPLKKGKKIGGLLNNLIPNKENPSEEFIQMYMELLGQNKLLQSKVKQLENEKNKLATVPNYRNIEKIALKGEGGYLFLVNDSNQEIRQHFDYSYNNNFDPYLFKKSLNSKKEFCKKNDIKYHFFIIPDKSVVCKEFLPFEIKLIKRNCDSIKSLVPDFIKKLDKSCYFNNNSHINYLGGKELAYCYLNYIDDLEKEKFDKTINEQISIKECLHNGDLTWPKNWSYSEEEKEIYLNEKVKTLKNKFLIDLGDNIPEKFKTVGIRKTEYYENPQGLSDMRVLMFRDSSLDFLKDVLSIYSKEVLLYWDHWFFNKELIEWYKPDIILEIRTERFLENMKYEFVE